MKTNLSDAVDDYERFRKSTDIAASTIKVQRTTLTKFLATTGNVWCHQVTSLHVTRFFEQAAKTRQPQTLRNDYTVLEGFFEWARKTKRMGSDTDPMYGRRKPKRAQKERFRLHVSKFPLLLDAAERRSPRDRIGCALVLYTLLRDGEVTDLRIRDVDLEGGWITARIHKSRLEDRIPICEELDGELRKWLTTYTEEVGYLEPHYRLVPSRDTKGIPDAQGVLATQEHVRFVPDRKVPALGKLVSPALADLGVPLRDAQGRPMGEGAHTLRRSGARAMFDALVGSGYDHALRVVQSFLHHSSQQTSEQYIGVSADKRSRDDLFRGRRMYDLGAERVTPLRRQA